MASERSTDVQAFIGELDGGVFETKIGAVLSEVAFLLCFVEKLIGLAGAI